MAQGGTSSLAVDILGTLDAHRLVPALVLQTQFIMVSHCEMKTAGVTEPYSSPCVIPAVIVRKKDWVCRFCMGYCLFQ